MNPLPLLPFSSALLASAALFTVSQVSAATIPYSNDFSSSGLGTEAGFTLGGGALSLSVSGSGTSVGTSSAQFSDAANASYTITSQFQITSLGTSPSNSQTVGIALFGLNSTFSGTSAASRYVLATWTVTGSLTPGALVLTEVDGSNVTYINGTADANGGAAGVVTTNTTYTLRVDVTNTGANLYDLTLGLYDAAGTTQFGTSASSIGYAATAEPGGGYFMGVRARLPFNGSGTTTVAFDNYTVTAIPEPSAYAAIGGFAALGLAIRRRRSVRA